MIKPAYELNVKPIIIRGKLEADSFASVDRDNIIIETVKPCEDNEKPISCACMMQKERIPELSCPWAGTPSACL